MRPHHISTLITALCLRGCPSTVLWRVRAVVVDAVKGVTYWTRTHVTGKRGEVFSPIGAHCDTASAVARIFWAVCVVTASLGATPTAVLARAEPAVALIEAVGSMFRGETSAALGVTEDR